MSIADRNKPLIKSNKNVLRDLTKTEIEILLTMVSASTFQGKDLETVYNLVIKLQDKYLELVALNPSTKEK